MENNLDNNFTTENNKWIKTTQHNNMQNNLDNTDYNMENNMNNNIISSMESLKTYILCNTIKNLDCFGLNHEKVRLVCQSCRKLRKPHQNNKLIQKFLYFFKRICPNCFAYYCPNCSIYYCIYYFSSYISINEIFVYTFLKNWFWFSQLFPIFFYILHYITFSALL